jgi:hypothetical protein
MRSTIGVSSHMYGGTGENADRDFELARYAELGVTQIRNDFLWEWLEPVQGQHNWEPVTGEVERVTAAGGNLIAIVTYRVGWAETNGGGDSSIDPALYAAEAGAIATQFCDDVKLYEIWNEPNGEGFWYPHPDPAHYSLFLKEAYKAVHDACPDAKVLFGGQGAVGSSLGWPFLKDVGQALPDVCQYFDIMAIHPYTFIQLWSPERDFRDETGGYAYPGQTGMTQYARDRMAEWGCPGKPIWYTEMGWPSYEIPEETVGRWAARSMLLAVRDRVDRYYWYTFWDGEPVTTGTRPHEAYFGLFGWPGDPVEPRRPKPAWHALTGLSQTVGDARYAADVSGSLGLPNDVYALAFLAADGTTVVAAWDGRDEPDDGPDGPGPGGPDTTEPLVLPIPPDATEVEVRDLAGTVTVPAAAPSGALALTLTPSVQYVIVRRGPLPTATCGNGRLDPHEACDGDLFPPAVGTCDDNNLGAGQAACRDDCTLDVSGCESTDYCEGNGFYADADCDACERMGGHADPACATGCGPDGRCVDWFDPAVGRWSCPAAGFPPDPDCGTCGNGKVEGREFCDGFAFGTFQGVDLGACENWGFTGGILSCRPDCRPDFQGCTGPG